MLKDIMYIVYTHTHLFLYDMAARGVFLPKIALSPSLPLSLSPSLPLSLSPSLPLSLFRRCSRSRLGRWRGCRWRRPGTRSLPHLRVYALHFSRPFSSPCAGSPFFCICLKRLSSFFPPL